MVTVLYLLLSVGYAVEKGVGLFILAHLGLQIVADEDILQFIELFDHARMPYRKPLRTLIRLSALSLSLSTFMPSKAHVRQSNSYGLLCLLRHIAAALR